MGYTAGDDWRNTLGKDMGRHARRWNPYDIARQIVMKVGLRSRKAYWAWHDNVKPIGIPKMPHRAYPEWEGWGDYLGIHNKFCPRKSHQYILYWEAVRWVHRRNYSSREKFVEAHRGGEIPDYIPLTPNAAYKDDWVSWSAWLGTNVLERIMSEKKNVAIMAILGSSDVNIPGNLLTIITFNDGISELDEYLKMNVNKVVKKLFVWESERRDIVSSIVEANGSEQGGNEYIISNMNQLLFDLSDQLLWYVPK